MDEIPLKDRVKAARKYGARFQPDKKLTQATLGKLVGVTQQSIQKLESGGSLESTTLLRIAKVCQVSAEWLADGSGEMLESHPLRGNVTTITSRREELGLSTAEVHARMLAYQWPEGIPPPSLATVEEWFDGKARPLDMVYRGMLYKALEMAVEPGEAGEDLIATTEVEADFLRMARAADPDETAQVMLLWKQIRQAKTKG